MHTTLKVMIICCAFTSSVLAQPAEPPALTDDEQLKMTALEALMTLPEDRALAIVTKVLAGNDSDAVKSRAVFVLSQIDLPEAGALLVDTARGASGPLQLEAIRALGVSGDPAALESLGELYRNGEAQVKEHVLQAYLIAGEASPVYQLAVNAQNDEEFAAAVRTLGAMGATDELGALREQGGNTETLIQAYSIAGDEQSLRDMAMDDSDPRAQIAAIQNLGMVGGDSVNQTLLDIYRGAGSNDVRNAALQGMMLSDFEAGLLEVYRGSDSAEEKRLLLQMLIAMDSEAALEIIDATFSENQQ